MNANSQRSNSDRDASCETSSQQQAFVVMMEPSGPKVTMRQHHRAELERLASGNQQTRAASRLSAIGSMPDKEAP